MKKTLIIEIEAEKDKPDLCDLIGGRIWTLFDGKRDVVVRVAGEHEITALLLANSDHANAVPNGHIEPGAQYGY